jgi:hypothetical protein
MGRPQRRLLERSRGGASGSESPPNQALHVTAAAILVFPGSAVLQPAAAGELGRSYITFHRQKHQDIAAIPCPSPSAGSLNGGGRQSPYFAFGFVRIEDLHMRQCAAQESLGQFAPGFFPNLLNN